MTKTEIRTDKAPMPGGSYSQAIQAGGFVFTAGQVGIDPATGELAGPTIEEQTKQVLENLSAVLAEAGATLADVVKVTTFLGDMTAHFPGYDAVYRTYFPEPRPARSTVGVDLRGLLVEIEAVAILPG